MKKLTTIIVLSTIFMQLGLSLEARVTGRTLKGPNSRKQSHTKSIKNNRNHVGKLEDKLTEALSKIGSPDPAKRSSALKGLTELVKANYTPAFEAAINAATKGIDYPNEFVRRDALELFSELVKANYKPALEATTNAATKWICCPIDPCIEEASLASVICDDLYDGVCSILDLCRATPVGNEDSGNVPEFCNGLHERGFKDTHNFVLFGGIEKVLFVHTGQADNAVTKPNQYPSEEHSLCTTDCLAGAGAIISLGYTHRDDCNFFLAGAQTGLYVYGTQDGKCFNTDVDDSGTRFTDLNSAPLDRCNDRWHRLPCIERPVPFIHVIHGREPNESEGTCIINDGSTSGDELSSYIYFVGLDVCSQNGIVDELYVTCMNKDVDDVSKLANNLRVVARSGQRGIHANATFTGFTIVCKEDTTEGKLQDTFCEEGAYYGVLTTNDGIYVTKKDIRCLTPFPDFTCDVRQTDCPNSCPPPEQCPQPEVCDEWCKICRTEDLAFTFLRNSSKRPDASQTVFGPSLEAKVTGRTLKGLDSRNLWIYYKHKNNRNHVINLEDKLTEARSLLDCWNSNLNAYEEGFVMLTDLIEQKHQPAFEIAINAATKGIDNPDYRGRRAALNLFSRLFKANYEPAFEVATNVATKMPIKYHRGAALDLFGELVEVNYKPAYEAATNAATKGIDYPNEFVCSNACNLFSKLFKVNYKPAYDAATNAATKGIDNPDYRVRIGALNLFAGLFRANYEPAFEAAISAATKGIDDDADVYVVRHAALKLFCKLVKTNYEPAMKAATHAATKGIDHASHPVRNGALNLFSRLFKANYEPAFEAATNAATKGIDHVDWLTRCVALFLFSKLIKASHEPAFSAATNAATKAINDPAHEVRNSALTLFSELVEMNYEPAFSAATKACLQGNR